MSRSLKLPVLSTDTLNPSMSLSPEQRSELKKSIISRIDELDTLLAIENEEAKPVAPDVAIGRLSRIDSMQGQQMALELRRRQEAERERLKDALRNIESPLFGICPLCRQAIPFERLEVMPDALLCVSCSPS